MARKWPTLTHSVRPIRTRRFELDEPEREFLGGLARRTWRYFEVYATERTHWLAPDNVQEVPHERIAERTSPTNIGMGLVANLAAYDFGFIAMPDFLTCDDPWFRPVDVTTS